MLSLFPAPGSGIPPPPDSPTSPSTSQGGSGSGGGGGGGGHLGGHPPFLGGLPTSTSPFLPGMLPHPSMLGPPTSQYVSTSSSIVVPFYLQKIFIYLYNTSSS